MTHRMPRDDGDDDPAQSPAPRPRGRVVPMQPPDEEPPEIPITVGGVQFGTVYPQELTARAQMDLERIYRSPTPSFDMLDWCVRYGGVDNTRRDANGKTDRDILEDTLADMPIGAVLDLVLGTQTALGQAMTVPKRSRRP